MQAKAAFGAKPAPQPRFARVVLRAKGGKGVAEKGEEPTKSEDSEKVEKAEKSKDKGSQALSKVRLDRGLVITRNQPRSLVATSALFLAERPQGGPSVLRI